MDRDGRSNAPSSAAAETEISLDVLPLHSTNLVTVLDANGVIQYESPSIERIYGYGQDELVGDQVSQYFHPDDRENVMGAFQTVVESEEYTVEAVEYRHKQVDGTYTWVESVASADPTPDGNYVINTRDISSRKKREQNLERTNKRLNEFASIVSHDLRNPLNVAQTRLELTQRECESEHLPHIERAHDRMETLVADLLTLSRVGKQVAETEVVSLERLIESCWQTVSTADATLVVDTNQQLLADESRLQQLLENLVRNSVEHGSTSSRAQSDDSVEHGGESLTVTVGTLETGFYVEDDGPGIKASERKQVFDAGTSGASDGTGLGLRIVKQIVDAHGWEVEITTGTQGGARFEITDVERR